MDRKKGRIIPTCTIGTGNGKDPKNGSTSQAIGHDVWDRFPFEWGRIVQPTGSFLNKSNESLNFVDMTVTWNDGQNNSKVHSVVMKVLELVICKNMGDTKTAALIDLFDFLQTAF